MMGASSGIRSEAEVISILEKFERRHDVFRRAVVKRNLPGRNDALAGRCRHLRREGNGRPERRRSGREGECHVGVRPDRADRVPDAGNERRLAIERKLGKNLRNDTAHDSERQFSPPAPWRTGVLSCI